MDSLFLSTLTKLALPAVAVVVVLFIGKGRGISPRDDLGLQRPEVLVLFGWIGLWLVCVVAGELLIEVFGLDQAKP